MCQAAEVREWLQEQIDEVVYDLEPPPPVYSQYELQRQRNIMSNHRVLLEIAQADLQRSPGERWRQDEFRKAEALLMDSVRLLEFMEQHVRDD